MKDFDLHGRTALVTGSTRGIGAALALALEEAGARVWRHGHTVEGKVQPETIRQDLLEPDAVNLLFEKLTGPVPDLLVCNAGSFFDKPFLEMDPATFEKPCVSTSSRPTSWCRPLPAGCLRKTGRARS